MTTDFAHTGHAERNRQEKARTLAAHCWASGVHLGTLADLAGFRDFYPQIAAWLRKVARDAGVNPPSIESPTWDAVVVLLGQRWEWDQAHPGDPRTIPPDPGRYDADFDEEDQPRAPAEGPAGTRDGGPPGWADLGPLPGTSCGWITGTSRGDVCDQPAVAWVPVRGDWRLDVPRCAGHPPAGDEWGARLTWTVKPCRLPVACWCHRHPAGAHTPWRPAL